MLAVVFASMHLYIFLIYLLLLQSIKNICSLIRYWSVRWNGCLICFFNRSSIDGTNCMKMCVWCLCVYMFKYVVDGLILFALTWESVHINIYDKIVPVCTCAVDRTLKSNYLLTFQWCNHAAIDHFEGYLPELTIYHFFSAIQNNYAAWADNPRNFVLAINE